MNTGQQVKDPPFEQERDDQQNNHNSSTAVNHFKLPPPAAESTANKPAGAVEKAAQERESQRDKVIEMVLELEGELFHDPAGNTYITVKNGKHKENLQLSSEAFKRYVHSAWYSDSGSGLAKSVVSDAAATLDAMASYSGSEYEVHLRAAHHGGAIYIDLCDEDWNVARITESGWTVTTNPPVKFIRRKGMQPIPMPTKGSIKFLRPLINAPTDDIWYLVVAWVLAAFSPGPYPILIVMGEQGSAKSFLCKVLRMLVDPSAVSSTSAPKDERDVIMAASNSYVCSFDNLSGMSGKLSDLFCSIATGAAHRERKYHSNNGDEELFQVKRPIIINGIDMSLRDDLLSRAVLVNLPTIPDDKRMDESELWGHIHSYVPQIIGGIFDILSAILRELPNAEVKNKPRMADFAKWITAAETALGWEKGKFMHLYEDNRSSAVELAIDSDPFGTALRDHMIDLQPQEEWTVSWENLLTRLRGDDKKSGWPTTAKAVATRLKRLAPALRHAGIHWAAQRDGNKRMYCITRIENDTAKPVE